MYIVPLNSKSPEPSFSYLMRSSKMLNHFPEVSLSIVSKKFHPLRFPDMMRRPT